MLQKIKLSLLSLMAMATFAVPLAITTGTAIAVESANIKDATCTGADTLQIPPNGTPTTQCDTLSTGSNDNINRIITDVINIFSVVVGVIAVIMIIVGGFRYITSGGQAEKVTGAKNTILYAIIGLIIVALAQVIVKFVLSKATSTA